MGHMSWCTQTYGLFIQISVAFPYKPVPEWRFPKNRFEGFWNCLELSEMDGNYAQI